MQQQVQNKAGCIILVIGRQGSGKTPVIKELLQNADMDTACIYDPRYEYDKEKYVIFHSYKFFKQFAFNPDAPIERSFIVCEEATGFVKSFKDTELTEACISIEHHNCTCVFAFHSILDCPLYLLRLSRFVILLPTNDTEQFVKSSRPNLYEHFLNENKPIYIDMNEN